MMKHNPVADHPADLTQALDLGSTPQAVGHALPHPGAHQRVARVAGEDRRSSVHRQRSDLVSVRWRAQVSAGDDWGERERES